MQASVSRVIVAAVFALMLLAGARPAQAGPSLSARMAFDEPLGAPSTIIATLDALPRAARVPVIARVDIDRQTIEPDGNGTYHFESLDARLAQYRDKQILVWLTLDGLTASRAAAPASVAASASPAARSPATAGSTAATAATAATARSDAWGRFVRALARHVASRAAIIELLPPDLSSLDDAALAAVAFDIKRAAVELHAADAKVLVALGAQRFADATRLEAFYARDLAAYLDAVAVGSSVSTVNSRDGGVAPDVPAAHAMLDRLDPTAVTIERGTTLDTDASVAWRTFISTELWRLGTASVVASYHATPAVLQGLLRQSAGYVDLLAGEFTRLDDASSQLTIEPAASPASATTAATPSTPEPPASAPAAGAAPALTHALVYDTAKFATFLIYARDAARNDGGGAASAAADASGAGAATAAGVTSAAGAATAAGATSAAGAATASGAASAARAATASGAASAAGSVRLSLKIASDAKPGVRDPLTGATRDVADFVRDTAAQRTTFTAPLPAAGQPLIIDFRDSLGNVVTERTEATGKTTLSVAEIVARHQQVQAAQDAYVRTYAVAARMEQHFRPAISDPGYDVVTENRFFVDDEQIEWEELSFSVNGSTWKENRPPFPILQPEKVLSVPLKLRMTADYHYRLAGTETVDGHECYVVHFDPSRGDQSLYRGVVWIDTATFVRWKLQAVQTKLSAPVVSNEETHHFEQVSTLDGRAIILPTRITSHQIVLIAGRNLLVDKETAFSGYDLNAPAFAAQRQSARASTRIMYRDTDHGIRYLEKQGEQRVVREKGTTSAKAIAMGTTIDPSFDFPLPIFGINYLDFNFHGPDSQLALLFAGVLALGNIQRPKLFGTPLDGSVDFFAIAVPGGDKIYGPGGERKTERLLTWPLSTGVNLGYQFTSFQKISAQYQFRFDAYVRDGRTDPEDYTAPSSTTTHGIGLAYEYKRAGYSVVTNGTWYGRVHWDPWGPADDLQTTPRTYDKYSVNVSKDWYLGLFQKVHANGAYFGGDRLDRFSLYQFGMFDDTKVHGVPSSGVRYGEIGMARGSYSFNIFEQYRFDLFLEQAFGRDRTMLTDWERITGVGAAVNVKGPWTTILKVDVGKSFLPARYRANGSTVIQILVLKPLGKG
jgi:hypothetical protein